MNKWLLNEVAYFNFYCRARQLVARGPNLAREGLTIGPRSIARMFTNLIKIVNKSTINRHVLVKVFQKWFVVKTHSTLTIYNVMFVKNMLANIVQSQTEAVCWRRKTI